MFEILKDKLSGDTALGFYDPNKDLQLVTDASNHAVGGILLQKYNDDTLNPYVILVEL